MSDSDYPTPPVDLDGIYWSQSLAAGIPTFDFRVESIYGCGSVSDSRRLSLQFAKDIFRCTFRLASVRASITVGNLEEVRFVGAS